MTKTHNILRVVTAVPATPFRGAYIDQRGREIPITERMILRACRELEAAAESIYGGLFDSRNSRLRTMRAESRVRKVS